MKVRHPTALLIVAILLGAALLGAGIVAGTFVVADASADGQTTADVASELAGEQQDSSATITVSGSGSVSASPDQAVVVLGSTASAENASQATSQLAEQVQSLREALTDAGLSNESVRTIDYQVGQERRENDTVYVARQTFEVTLDDPNAVGSIIDTAVANGASEVFAVQFTLSEERARELRQTAIDRAIADANGQAEAVAASSNLTVDSVRSVSLGNGGAQPFAETAAADAGTDIDVGPVSVTANVQVTYNATAN